MMIKNILIVALACAALLVPAEADAQGFLKKLKQKAQQAVGLTADRQEESGENVEQTDGNNISVPSGSDIVPKRRTVTLNWDGIIKPSTASSASTLMSELPSLPTAEEMARSTMEERDTYFRHILSVVTRAEELEKNATGCSDAEIEVLRDKWERKVQELFGLTKTEMTILNDESATEVQKKPIREKVMMKITGTNPGSMDLEKLGKMSEKEQEDYLKAHPEFIQQMQQIAMNTRNFSNQTKQMTQAFSSYEAKMGKLAQSHIRFVMHEENHSYESIAKKYAGKLEVIKQKICDTDNAIEIERLYDEADKLIYSYRLEAAKEYRASLQRQIDESKKYTTEMIRLSRKLVADGELPECVIGRMDMNAVINVGNLLKNAYDKLPAASFSLPVCSEVLYQLPEGWTFCSWECGYPVGRGATASDLPRIGVGGFGCEWPLLLKRDTKDNGTEYAVWECGKIRKICEEELNNLNKQTDKRRKHQVKNGDTPVYGIYKSRSGKRTVEYSRSGELIFNGMMTFTPLVFSPQSDRLEWLMFDEDKVVKCTYKL